MPDETLASTSVEIEEDVDDIAIQTTNDVQSTLSGRRRRAP